MYAVCAIFLVIQVVLATALPSDPVLSSWGEGLRYDYMETDDGDLQLVDNWMKLSDYERLARYNPDNSNRYHLFTRANPSISQPLVLNNAGTVTNSNFRANRRTIILMHGFAGSITSGFNTVLVPAFLAAADVNVIALDWSAGSSWGPRAIQAGQAAGRFLNWLIRISGTTPNNFHVVGYSVGGHGAGIIARTVNGNVGYVTGCDPADRWEAGWNFRPNDGLYTEVIHTNVGNIGMTQPLAQADFYPNGGRNMPGCATALCDHYRSYYYLGESLRTGGFTGRRCANLQQALNGNCNASGTLRMGGIQPKNGNSGIFHLTTNPLPPFSRG
ncbi:pancreatic lipase-related protein 2-like [Anticarsia gemmatalis]|uniref:pancreatic lipase-related protein 2-like n=1 Tax=Anticarsia gemmatalis TaxID=129554 RepID=UPI003F776713